MTELDWNWEGIFGPFPEDRDELFEQARSSAVLQTRAQIVDGDGLELAVLRGSFTVQAVYGLDDDETKRVAKEMFKEFFGKDHADIEAEAEAFWQRSWEEFLAQAPEYMKMAGTVPTEVVDDKEEK